MAKRIVIRMKSTEPEKARAAGEPTWAQGKEQRRKPRRSGLPRRVDPDRRSRDGALAASAAGRKEKRAGVRRSLADRRRRRDRRFGLDPRIYDRLADLEL